MIICYWSVICLVSTFHYVSSVRDSRHYNKGPCGPYGFRCLNDRVFEICGEMKRSNDFSYTDNEELNPPIGSKAQCPEDRECDNENPLYCTLLGRRSARKQNKHKKCNEQTEPPPPTYEQEENEEVDYDEANQEELEQQTESSCTQETTCSSHTTEIVFDESKSKSGKGSGGCAGMQGDLNSQGAAGSTSGPYEVFSKPCKTPTKEQCDKNHQHEPPVVFDESKSQGLACCEQNTEKALGGASSNLYEVYPQDNCTHDVPCDDQGPNSNLFPGDIPEMTSHPPKELVKPSCDIFACTRAGNFADPKDCTRYYFCDVNANGDGFVAYRRSCRCGEVFNTALRECIPIENLHADARRCSEHKFKCVHCGSFPDPKDCSKYYHCELDEENCGGFKLSHRKCPHGKKFDKHLKKCVCTHSSEEEEEEEADAVLPREERRCGGGCARGEVTCPSPRPPCGQPGCSVTVTPPSPKPCDKEDDGLADIASMNLGEPTGDEYGGSDDDTCCPDLYKAHRFTCRQEGKFADPLNSTAFTFCHPKRADKGFYKIKMNCPTGEVFDVEKQRCVFKHER